MKEFEILTLLRMVVKRKRRKLSVRLEVLSQEEYRF